MEQQDLPEFRRQEEPAVAPAGMGDDLCRVAERLLDRGEIEQARALLASVLETDLDHATALVLMARIGLLDGCPEEARKILEHVLVAEPGHAMARTVLAGVPGVEGSSAASEVGERFFRDPSIPSLEWYDGANLVFIVGSPRSGTTWLLSLLKEHPDVLAATVDNLGIRTDPARTLETAVFGSRLGLRDADVRSRFHSLSRSHPGKVVVEKTPAHLLDVDRILRIFPRAAVVLVSRDARDVVASMVRVGRDPHAWWKGAPASVEEAARLWRGFAEVARDCARRHAPYTVRYEDLHRDTPAELGRLLAALGLHLESIDAQVRSSRGGRNIPIRGVFREARVGGWRSVLTPEEEQVFLEIAGDLAGV